MSIVFLIFCVLALVATATDVATYTIPNWLVLALLFVFIALAFADMPHGAWQSHLLAGGGCLVIAATLYGFGAMGAGDAKLIAVMALWAGADGLIPLLFYISLIGFAGMLVIVALRFVLPLMMRHRWLRLREPLPRMLRKGEGIPYAIGIGPGAIIAAGTFPHWLWQV